MKKILALILVAFSISASANGYYRGGYYGYRGPVYVNNYGYNNNWVAPALAGAVVGGLVARQYYAPPVVYVQPQQPVYIQQPPPAPPAYPQPADMHWEAILDARCNCYKTVLVNN